MDQRPEWTCRSKHGDGYLTKTVSHWPATDAAGNPWPMTAPAAAEYFIGHFQHPWKDGDEVEVEVQIDASTWKRFRVTVEVVRTYRSEEM